MKLGLIPKLLLGLVLGIVVGIYAPLWLTSITETGRVFLGNLIKFFIPFIIFSFIAASIAQLKDSAGKLLSFTVSLSYVDTIIGCTMAAVTSYILIPGFVNGKSFSETTAATIGEPIVEIAFPPLMDIMSALVLAIVIGLAASWGKSKLIATAVEELKDIIDIVIRKFMIPVIPIFIFCIFVGISAKGELSGAIVVFGKMLLLIIIMQLIWLIIEYTVAGFISKSNPFTAVKCMLPAYITAMGTMSSAATMPISLRQAKTIPVMDKKIADFVMPLCANIHSAGAALTLTISAITVSVLTKGELPPVSLIIVFIIVLGIVLTGAAGVPGGSVLATLGILQSILGFDEVGLGLMLALFMVQDTFGTATNITGDGALALIVNRFFGKKVNNQEVLKGDLHVTGENN
ncbi:cation:dicarboxylate symporter family transporter [Sporosarcina soli]|uniref:Cation:dicarboxylate symporter family transporter n=1 Tax=Sporosarcina soli TaxID=334736 RepID=A0ABW0TJ01_9BACL